MKNIDNTFLEPGNKVLVVHRRLFEKDRPRFFLGVVEAFNEANGLIKISGRSTGLAKAGGLATKKEKVTKVVSLTSGTLIVYQLETGTDTESAAIRITREGGVHLMAGDKLLLDLSEAVGA